MKKDLVHESPSPVETIIGQATPSPGEWKASVNRDLIYAVRDCAQGRETKFLAQVLKSHPIVEGEAEANANLFAAARDMLAALKELDAQWSEDRPSGPDTKTRPGFPEMHSTTKTVWRQIRAAIAKATMTAPKGEHTQTSREPK